MVELAHCLFCGIDCRMHCWIWVLVEAIQILIQCILSVVTSKNSIRVQAWYDLKDETVPQNLCLLIITI